MTMIKNNKKPSARTKFGTNCVGIGVFAIKNTKGKNAGDYYFDFNAPMSSNVK